MLKHRLTFVFKGPKDKPVPTMDQRLTDAELTSTPIVCSLEWIVSAASSVA